MELGFALTTRELEVAYTAFTGLADRKKRVYDQDLISLLSTTRLNTEKSVVGAAA